jgi:hypothetical protein
MTTPPSGGVVVGGSNVWAFVSSKQKTAQTHGCFDKFCLAHKKGFKTEVLKPLMLVASREAEAKI